MKSSLNEPIIIPADHLATVRDSRGEVSSWMVPGRKADPISSVRGHPKLSFWLMFGLLAAGLLVAFFYAPRTYRAESTIRVTPTYIASLSVNSEVRFDTNVEYRDYTEQQIYEIENYATAAKALTLLGPRQVVFQLPGETMRHAAERLMKVIEVHAVPDTYLITISLETSDPKIAAEIVNALAQAYLERHSQQELDLNRERLHQLTDRKSQLEKQIQDRSVQLSQLTEELGTSSFDPMMGNPYEKMRSETATALDVAKHSLIKVQAHLAAIQGEQVRLKNLELNSAAEQLLATNGGSNDATAELRKQRESTFLELRGLAPNHPGRKVLEKKITDINAEIEDLHKSALTNLRSMLSQRRSTAAQQQLDIGEARVEEVQREVQGLETQVTNLEREAAWYATKYNQGLTLQSAIQRHQKEIEELDSRLNSVLTEAHTPGIVQLEAKAQVPDSPEKGKRRKVALVFGMLALVLGVGAPTFMDLTDGKVRTIAELEETLGIPALGFAELGGNTERMPSRDLLRRIALAIVRERRDSGSRVFVLTSVNRRAGTTCLALALEHELNMLGANAVALEANPLSPDPRYREPRLVNGNATSLATNGAINKGTNDHATPYIHLNGVDRNFLQHIVTTGPHGYVEIAPQLLKDLLDEQLAKRDIVLLDTAPLLDSADTEMLIQTSAATILIVRAEQDSVERVKAAAKAISRISPPVFGTVLVQSNYTSMVPELPRDVLARAANIEPFQNIDEEPPLANEVVT